MCKFNYFYCINWKKYYKFTTFSWQSWRFHLKLTHLFVCQSIVYKVLFDSTTFPFHLFFFMGLHGSGFGAMQNDWVNQYFYKFVFQGNVAVHPSQIRCISAVQFPVFNISVPSVNRLTDTQLGTVLYQAYYCSPCQQSLFPFSCVNFYSMIIASFFFCIFFF